MSYQLYIITDLAFPSASHTALNYAYLHYSMQSLNNSSYSLYPLANLTFKLTKYADTLGNHLLS